MIKKIFDFISCKRPRSDSKAQNPRKKPKNYIICGICKDIIAFSSTLRCGHSFCELCLTQYMLYNPGCPKCDEYVRNAPSFPCYTLDQVIEAEIPSSKLENWQTRQKDLEKAKKSAKIIRPYIGMKIDVKDQEGI